MLGKVDGTKAGPNSGIALMAEATAAQTVNIIIIIICEKGFVRRAGKVVQHGARAGLSWLWGCDGTTR